MANGWAGVREGVRQCDKQKRLLLSAFACVGSGGSVAMNMDSGDSPLILLAPAWRRWGNARSVKSNTVVIHSVHDEFVDFSDSVELCGTSGATLIAQGRTIG